MKSDEIACIRQASKAVSLAELQQLVLKASVLQKHLGLEPELLSKACRSRVPFNASNKISSPRKRILCNSYVQTIMHLY